MDVRAEKLANARKKLRDHQEKKVVVNTKDNESYNINQNNVFVAQSTEQASPIVQEQCVVNRNINTNYVPEDVVVKPQHNSEVNITEILLTDKTNLEMQIRDLSANIMEYETNHKSQMKQNQFLQDRVQFLESELNNVKKLLSFATDENSQNENIIDDLKISLMKFESDNNNMIEQLEVTKTLLKSKEADIAKLQNDNTNLYNQLEVAKLQIQQLTNDSAVRLNHVNKNAQNDEALAQKILALQHEIDTLKKERDQNITHYEHYVRDLDEQLRSARANKDQYTEELDRLYQRENSLVEQISDMEIRLQNYSNIRETTTEQYHVDLTALRDKYKQTERQLKDITTKYNDLQQQHNSCLQQLRELSMEREALCVHDNISISKLNADITSDKLAAQRATEQNKKLKLDIEDLEQVVVKMTKDKLELTELLNHEKSLNKELILKLTDIEESTKNMNDKLRAKDEEMMRLQSGYREIEKKHGKLLEDLTLVKEKTEEHASECEHVISNNNVDQEHNHTCETTETDSKPPEVEKINIPNNDAMNKLQERFLKIMNEVANLSDEKHRLEHIILQLQTETDTICEYVALYQQQRSLLKKREEERNNQLSVFQKECNQLKHHIEELCNLVLLTLEDPKLGAYFRNEGRLDDLDKIKHLFDILLNNKIIDSQLTSLDLNVFYPCSCCSGQLIDV